MAIDHERERRNGEAMTADREQTRRDALRRTDEQLELIRNRFKPDGLLRLAHSTQDYYDQKGYYLPDVAALAYVTACELEQAEAKWAERHLAEQRAANMMVEQAERERDKWKRRYENSVTGTGN